MTELILASGSATRRRILERAGVPFTVRPAVVDEAAARETMMADGLDVAQAAVDLAELKALRVSSGAPGALVLGCDQMLECEGRWFEKADTLDAARASLRSMVGRTHLLASGACLALDGRRVWGHVETCRMTMRSFDEAFLDHYLGVVGDSVLGSVGCYQYEGFGVQLFSRIEGDYFSILGLPLLPILGMLRLHGVIQA